jgi:nucleotide-binding universal stress UspA family protein
MKILVATDGSRGGRAAVEYVARMGRELRSSQVHVVVVGTLRRDSILGVSGVPFPVMILPEFEKKERQAAERILAGAARRISRRDVRVQTRFLVPRDLAPVAEVIARESKRIEADLVVVGSQGRSALPGVVLGSVPLKLIYRCPCAVAVVHPRRRKR